MRERAGSCRSPELAVRHDSGVSGYSPTAASTFVTHALEHPRGRVSSALFATTAKSSICWKAESHG